jgi:hypothetical protein
VRILQGDLDKEKMESVPGVSAYRRVNHMREWLARLQVRTRTRIPLEVVWAVQDALPDHWQLSCDVVIQTLYRLRLHKLVEHCVQLLCRISGMAPISLDPRTEEHFLFLFCCAEKSFRKRWNGISFLRYPFVGFKLLQLLDVDVYTFIQTPRNVVGLKRDEETWCLICDDLGWKFIPFPGL